MRLDLSMMYAVHDALRRDLVQISRITKRSHDDPRHLLRTALGWELFKSYLHIHHTSEDDVLWPTLQTALDGRPDDLALLEALEAEHAAIDPMLTAIDVALADRDHGPQQLGDLTDELATLLTGHLSHEEQDGLPVIDAILTEEQWLTFGTEHRARVGDDTPRYLPWVLDGADDERIRSILDRMPQPVQASYYEKWLPTYAELNPWG